MALNLTIPGGKVQLSGNRVQAEVSTDTVTGEMYKLLLKTTSPAGFFPEGIDAIEPDANNKAIFDIRNRVSMPVIYSFTWPLTGAVAVEHPQMAQLVQIDVGERFVQVVNNENSDTVNWARLSENNEVLILKGGVSKHQQSKYNEQNTTFYIEWIQAGKFLTLLPDGLVVSPGQPVKLWIIIPGTEAQELTLKVAYENAGGDSGFVTHAITVNPGTMTELCTDPGSLGLDASAVVAFSVWLERSGVVVGEVRNFTVDRNYYEQNIYVLFVNQVGGIDCLWFHGQMRKAYPVESETSRRDARINDTQPRGTVEVDYKTSRRQWTVKTGYMSAVNMEALPSLFESRNVWLLDGNDIIPVRIPDGENEYLDTMNDIHDIDIVFIEAH